MNSTTTTLHFNKSWTTLLMRIRTLTAKLNSSSSLRSSENPPEEIVRQIVCMYALVWIAALYKECRD